MPKGVSPAGDFISPAELGSWLMLGPCTWDNGSNRLVHTEPRPTGALLATRGPY